MKTRRIQAKDIHSALRKVRRVLGVEAVILGTRELSEGFEVIAASGFAGLGASAAKTGNESFSRTLQAAGQAELEARIVRSQQSRHATTAQRSLGQIDVLNISQDLNRLGLSSDIRKALIKQLNPGANSPWMNAPALLAQALPEASEKVLETGGTMALLGPAGVGKTTTIAKLAAHFARRHGTDQVALINTDCYRIGATEQLNRYARLIGVEVHQLQTTKTLGALLKSLSHKRLILIDSAGNSHEDADLMQQLRMPGSGYESVPCYLTLSHNTQIAAMERTARLFARLSLHGSILTKQDEAVTMGAALSIVLRHKLPVAFVTTGIRVPADIRIQSTGQLAKQAFVMMDKAAMYSDIGAFQQQQTGTF